MGIGESKKDCKTPSARRKKATAIMNSQLLPLKAPGLHRIGPTNSLLWTRECLMGPPPPAQMNKFWLLTNFEVGESLSSAVHQLISPPGFNLKFPKLRVKQMAGVKLTGSWNKSHECGNKICREERGFDKSGGEKSEYFPYMNEIVKEQNCLKKDP